MPKFITDHVLNGLNECLQIEARDEPGQGGARHRYVIGVFDTDGHSIDQDVHINFQNGPIKEAGVNGISVESLLAICIDRLRDFQAGPFACRENALALTHMQESMHWLQHRTRERLARGVEGTNQK